MRVFRLRCPSMTLDISCRRVPQEPPGLLPRGAFKSTVEEKEQYSDQVKKSSSRGIVDILMEGL